MTLAAGVTIWRDARDDKLPWRVTHVHGATGSLVDVYRFRDEQDARDLARELPRRPAPARARPLSGTRNP